MKSRLHSLEIRNFKAFREFSVAPEGRHLLVYGSNGSGKSSLYWTLHTFLQSAHKPTPNVAKYFDPADPQNLLNVHEQAEANPRPGETLSQNLRAARKKLMEKLPVQLYEKVLTDTPEMHREYVLPATDADVDAIPGLNQADRDVLKEQRKKLRTLLTDVHWKAIENAKLIDEVLKTTERVLNSGAHGGQAPLYKAEVQKALDLIAKLETCLA